MSPQIRLRNPKSPILHWENMLKVPVLSQNFTRSLRKDFADLRFKAHVKHAICLTSAGWHIINCRCQRDKNFMKVENI